MAYKPEPPEPPKPTESVTLFGVRDGARRLGFLLGYFGACALATKACLGCSVPQLIFLHAVWFICGCFTARDLNRLLCELADVDAQREHARAMHAYSLQLLEVMTKQPYLGEKLSPETGQLEAVRLPLKESPPRPLIDKDMGVRVRV